MNAAGRTTGCIPVELITAYAVGAIPAREAAVFARHITECAECQREFASLRPLVESLNAWPMDVLQSAASLWEQRGLRGADESGARHPVVGGNP